MSHSVDRIAIDVGNTSAKVGWFTGYELIGQRRVGWEDWPVILQGVTNQNDLKIIYSSVANALPEPFFEKCLQLGVPVHPLRRDPFPFPTHYRTLSTLGADRIGAVAGARGLQSANTMGPLLVVDAGTCATMDLLDASGTHLGGNITPGVSLRLTSMADATRLLPRLAPKTYTGGNLGLSTEQAVAAGGVLSVVLELEALFLRLEQQHPGLSILLTGGDGPVLQPYLKVATKLYPHLVLRGLIQLLSTYDEP